ncbi:MAG: ornithine carbamoyltransferase [Chloroflexi bacterium]|nr:ornithine carbamoyltransferase [Chloroflexota bacterium]
MLYLKPRRAYVRGKDLLSIADLEAEDVWHLIRNAQVLKGEGASNVLAGMCLALLFEKPSLRTRLSFELAMSQLGGSSIYLSPQEVGVGSRESVADVALVLSRYVDAVVARTFRQATVDSLAHYASIPVINGLSDVEHPCQALADLLTIYEKLGQLEGVTIAFIGDGNNVASSLLLAASLVGAHFHIASPIGYAIPEGIMSQARSFAAKSHSRIEKAGDFRVAVHSADVVYTDVWISMGQEEEKEERRAAFANYQVNAHLLAQAPKGAIFMHPLPAHYGEEVTEEVARGPQSAIFDQAENRLHLQKALLMDLLANAKPGRMEKGNGSVD